MPAAHSTETGNGTGPDDNPAIFFCHRESLGLGLNFACGEGSRCKYQCLHRMLSAEFGIHVHVRKVHVDPSPVMSSRSLKPLFEISCLCVDGWCS